MKYLSQFFQPIITIPKNAKIKNTEITCKSQKLLLECGLIRPTSAGLFAVLPLARRALHKLETLIRTCLDAAGGQQMSLPALTSVSLWEQSGRLQGAPAELLKLEDRHGKKYLLAPTHEESIAELIADVGPLSYKQLPLLLYQLGRKFRDEPRAKHGLLRAREFSMCDAYGLHTHARCAQHTYSAVTQAYNRLFETLQLPVYKVEAPSGEMGGPLSHEWQICAGAGEDSLSVCLSCSHATLEERDSCQCGGKVERRNSIEVGHTFILGTKYSEALKARYVSAEGKSQDLIMSCYGIGITRLLAASIEALSTEKALRWPEAIAPFGTIVIGPKEGSKEWLAHGPERVRAVCGAAAARAGGAAAARAGGAATAGAGAGAAAAGAGAGAAAARAGDDVLLDDRHALTVGKRMLMADRMGYPTIIVCGKSTLESPPRYEVYRTADGNQPQMCTLEQLAADNLRNNTTVNKV